MLALLPSVRSTESLGSRGVVGLAASAPTPVPLLLTWGPWRTRRSYWPRAFVAKAILGSFWESFGADGRSRRGVDNAFSRERVEGSAADSVEYES